MIIWRRKKLRAPVDLEAVEAPLGAVLDWALPANENPANITGWVVQYRVANLIPWLVFSTLSTATPGETLVGLTASVSYHVRVAAVNRRGKRGRFCPFVTFTAGIGI